MKTYLLLFRGINVGGNNLLPMKALVTLLEGSGYQQVRTYIQSGNVVLCSQEIPNKDINKIIETNFGFKPKIWVLEKPEFEKAVKNNPFESKQGKTIHFFFLAETPSPDIERLNSLATASETYFILDNVFYLHAPDGIGRSKLAAKIESCLGVSGTGRNLNTVNKLLAMFESG